MNTDNQIERGKDKSAHVLSDGSTALVEDFPELRITIDEATEVHPVEMVESQWHKVRTGMAGKTVVLDKESKTLTLKAKSKQETES